MPVTLKSHVEKWTAKEPFRISGYTFTEIDIAVATISDEQFQGIGEACGVYYNDDTAENITSVLEQFTQDFSLDKLTRNSLIEHLPAGGARNALDAALWDLEAVKEGVPVWKLAQISKPKPLTTAFTIGAGEPEHMALTAQGLSQAKIIKLKLTGDPIDAERLKAVRKARPDVNLAIDANQGFTPDSLENLMPVLTQVNTFLIEQPFSVGQEHLMAHYNSPIPTAADESVQVLSDIEPLIGLFDMINIKLDKCGGLTHGLAMAKEARKLGFKVMVGNMGGTSRAQAPAFMLGQLCDFVDLDGPTLLKKDRPFSARYENGQIYCPETVWGQGAI